jgi:adenosylcobinamide-phosphate synthase
VARRDILLASLACDLIWGEPPDRLHPVVWMGNGSKAVRRAGRGRRPAAAFGIGLAGLIGGVWMSWIVARRYEQVSATLPGVLRLGLDAIAVKPMFAVRELFGAVRRIETALAHDQLGRARALLGRHLVSRPTSALAAHEVAAAAIESLAENLSDSIIAPWLAYRVAGLPAAAAYRFVNTADAMLGYRTAELEWLGKPAARLDDLLNLVPARLTAGLIAISASAGGGTPARAWHVARRDSQLTASPNAGWPMAAMAGALDRRLTKRGAYCLNHEAKEPSATDIRRARRIAAAAVAGATLLFAP